MKQYKARHFILFAILLLAASFITFYADFLLTTAISNYEAITIVSFAGLPFYVLTIFMIMLIFFLYKYMFRGMNSPYTIKRYSLMLAITSSVGVASSIFVGTVVYHSFVKEYVFTAYPLVMLISFILFFGLFLYTFIKSIVTIKKTNPEKEPKANKRQVWRNIIMAVVLYFSLNRFGGLLYLPVFGNLYNIIAIPFYIEMAFPLILLIIACIYLDIKRRTMKRVVVLTSFIVLLYSFASAIYMILINEALGTALTSVLTPILLLEKLIKFPLDFVLTYAFAIGVSISALILYVVKIGKDIERKNKLLAELQEEKKNAE